MRNRRLLFYIKLYSFELFLPIFLTIFLIDVILMYPKRHRFITSKFDLFKSKNG